MLFLTRTGKIIGFSRAKKIKLDKTDLILDLKTGYGTERNTMNNVITTAPGSIVQ